MTVTGPVTLSFYWKVSSEASYDYLRVYLDSVKQYEISGEVNWQQKSINIPSGSHNGQVGVFEGRWWWQRFRISRDWVDQVCVAVIQDSRRT